VRLSGTIRAARANTGPPVSCVHAVVPRRSVSPRLTDSAIVLLMGGIINHGLVYFLLQAVIDYADHGIAQISLLF